MLYILIVIAEQGLVGHNYTIELCFCACAAWIYIYKASQSEFYSHAPSHDCNIKKQRVNFLLR